MAVNLTKALKFNFRLTFDGVVVMDGKASATMLYEVQKLHAFSVSGMESPYSNPYDRGSFKSLDFILTTPVGCSDCWEVRDGAGKVFSFWYERERY